MNPEDIKNVFGENLRRIRMEKNISQENLAFLSGMDRTYVSGIERGKRNVSLVNINKIALALNVEIKELF
ncbi:helix-turn-helix domain-containing protein [Klebsiella michiganensis]|jgi:transcriptional regulator with XRE-family HTH domain|uniref:helix-turn-helix domain-containing protein n=1 Tax=Klebsiella TaxID=570 RepID=UPI000B9FF8C7|nr:MULTISPECIES: helix-turn-helix transcriptional regulator [Klebsiella]MBV0456414.1 helix-turn-helix domain-containing protein [Klebsiella pneumoniae]HEC2559929.1 helix-turn-helix transcriptional regulator [Raoultella ornithinolytica]MBV2203657.1 helix-turn-helix domain-containing protein [Klebsiella variicola]MDH1974909.1 helix-turn-helix domain-containing protein [Klebsiella michiganensis]OZQ42264.1 transcriptional regulator [Klebsiella variicola]